MMSDHQGAMPAAQHHGGRDLAGRDDVEVLLRRFYGRALYDDLLGEPFAEIRAQGLESHLPVMCDFWETVLFRTGRYRRSALRAHQHVHYRVPLSANHFLRWLTLWNSTVDQMFAGPVAEHAKIQAARIAGAMHRRLTGADAHELDARATTPKLGFPAQPRGNTTVSHRNRRRVMTRTTVHVRRIYDEPTPADGYRVLVDRIWPRGISKSRARLDQWCKEIAPSTELRKWYHHDPDRFAEFSRRYCNELTDTTRAAALNELRRLVSEKTLTLLTATKDPTISEAAVLADLVSGKNTHP